MRCVRVTIVVVEKQYILCILSVCICNLNYPTRNAHASYYFAICGLPDHKTFTTLSHKRHDFWWGGTTEHKMCLDFLYIFCLKKFLFSEEFSQIISQMYIYRSWCEVGLLVSDFNHFVFSRQIFEKCWHIKFVKIRSYSRLSTRTDRQAWWNKQSLFAVLRERLRISLVLVLLLPQIKVLSK